MAPIGDHPEAHGPERHDESDVAGDSPGERRGDSRVHHQEALPPVEECDLRPERLPQVDIAASRIGITGGQAP